MEVMDLDVHLPGVDADNGAILFVEFDNLEGVLAAKDYIVIELVELCRSRQLRSRNVGKRTEAQSLNH